MTDPTGVNKSTDDVANAAKAVVGTVGNAAQTVKVDILAERKSALTRLKNTLRKWVSWL